MKKAKDIIAKQKAEKEQKEKVHLPTGKEEQQAEEKVQQNIIIPGMKKPEENAKKVVVIESDKYTPNFEVSDITTDGVS